MEGRPVELLVQRVDEGWNEKSAANGSTGWFEVWPASGSATTTAGFGSLGGRPNGLGRSRPKIAGPGGKTQTMSIQAAGADHLGYTCPLCTLASPQLAVGEHRPLQR